MFKTIVLLLVAVVMKGFEWIGFALDRALLLICWFLIGSFGRRSVRFSGGWQGEERSGFYQAGQMIDRLLLRTVYRADSARRCADRVAELKREDPRWEYRVREVQSGEFVITTGCRDPKLIEEFKHRNATAERNWP